LPRTTRMCIGTLKPIFCDNRPVTSLIGKFFSFDLNSKVSKKGSTDGLPKSKISALYDVSVKYQKAHIVIYPQSMTVSVSSYLRSDRSRWLTRKMRWRRVMIYWKEISAIYSTREPRWTKMKLNNKQTASQRETDATRKDDVTRTKKRWWNVNEAWQKEKMMQYEMWTKTN
jgi:hypothetical protein